MDCRSAGTGRGERKLTLASRIGICLALAIALGVKASAQVTIDGSTSTTVTLGSDGSVTVGVAPAPTRDSLSLNRFEEFNVPAAGVNLDNRTTAARTIVNEVTGTSDTRIEGPVEVLGQRAHVIVANPNGIVIDNGRFINTGRVALTTGQLGSATQQIAPGIFQNNVTSSVTGGRITVEGGGLSGQMDSIDLIAQDVRINGAISNLSTNEGSGIRIVAGSNDIEFDSSVLVGNTSLNWGRITPKNQVNDGVLVAVGDNGLLEGGSIEILVNDAGAGVRYAGEGRATSRSFVLQSDGKVEFAGSRLSAAETFWVQSGETVFDDSILTAAQLAFQSASNLTFSAAAIEATTGDIATEADAAQSFQDSNLTSASSFVVTAGTKLEFKDTTATNFAHVVIDAEDLNLENSTVEARNGSLVASVSGDLLNISSTLQGGAENAGVSTLSGLTSAGAVTLDVGGTFRNVSDAELGVVFGAAGDVKIDTQDDLINERGRILANGDISLFAAGDVINLLPAGPLATTPDVETYARKGNRVWWTLWLKQRRTSGSVYDYGTIENLDDVPIINAIGGLSIEAKTVSNRGGEFSSSDGDLSIEAVTIETIGLGSGRVEVETVCVISCRAEGSGEVLFAGGRLNASETINLTASDSFTNQRGQVFASENIVIDAPEIVLEAALVPTLVQRSLGLYNFWSSKDAWVLLRDQFGTIIAETGSITINSRDPVKRIGGELSAGLGIELSAGEELVRAPQSSSQFRQRNIGWLSDWPFVKD